MSKSGLTGIIGVSTPEAARYSVFFATLSNMARPNGVSTVFSRGAVISDNRNKITAELLNSDAEWVLYLDDDHILQADTLIRLLDANKDVISAHYIQRQPPFNPVLMDAELPNGNFMWKQLSPGESGIISVAAAGAGCLLVRRKVIEALEYPYWTLGQIHPSSWGDDLHFCSRVRKAGFEIHCDLDNRIGHMMTGIVYPTCDKDQGWLAAYKQDVGRQPLAKWPMPLPGDI